MFDVNLTNLNPLFFGLYLNNHLARGHVLPDENDVTDKGLEPGTVGLQSFPRLVKAAEQSSNSNLGFPGGAYE